MGRNLALVRWVLLVVLAATRHGAVSPCAGEFPGAEPLRTAIRDLTATFHARYPRGGEFWPA